jgi:hypothetical protein
MKYLKIYENYFSDRDEIDELYIKKENDFIQEVLDLIPDICDIKGFKLKKQFSNKKTVGLNIGFENSLNQDSSVLLKDYKDIIISDMHRLDRFLLSDYNIIYSIQLGVFDSSGKFISPYVCKDIDINFLKSLIKNTSESKSKNEFYALTSILIYINRK